MGRISRWTRAGEETIRNATIKLPSGSAGRHLRSRLEEGNAVAHPLLKAGHFIEGSFSTVLPVNISIEQAEEYDRGGKFPIPKREHWVATNDATFVPLVTADAELAKIIDNYLSAHGRRLLILENVLDRPGEPLSNDIPFVVNGDAIYHFLISESYSLDQVRAAAGAITWQPYPVAILTSLGNAPIQLENGRNVSLDTLQRLCDHAALILTGAYDGESFVCCQL